MDNPAGPKWIVSGENSLQLGMNGLFSLEAIGQCRGVSAHVCFRSLNCEFGVPRAGLLQSEGIRDQPVGHIALFGPRYLGNPDVSVMHFESEHPIAQLVECGFQRGENERRVRGGDHLNPYVGAEFLNTFKIDGKITRCHCGWR